MCRPEVYLDLETVRGGDPGWLPEGLHYEFHFRRQLIEPPDDMVRTILDGGKTVYAKVSCVGRGDAKRVNIVGLRCGWIRI